MAFYCKKRERVWIKRCFAVLIVLCILVVFELHLHISAEGDIDRSVRTKSLSSSLLSSSSSSSSSPLSSSLEREAAASPKSQKRQVLLITRSRSGSSYTAAIINNHPSVFYTFEPFQIMDKIGWPENEEVRYEKVLTVLKFHLLCGIKNISANDMKLDFLKRTTYGFNFYSCENKQNDGFSHIQCFLDYMKLCLNSEVSFAKVIRVQMRDAEPLLQEFPNLKILYLIRDPRAVLYSRLKSFKKTNDWSVINVDGKSNGHCRKIDMDTKEVRRLKALYPGRIRFIRFENGATDPITYAKEIYDYIGLDFTIDTKRYIKYLQSSDSSENQEPYDLRRNATNVVNEWRLVKGSYKMVQSVDKYCGKLYAEFGYIKVKSEKHLLSLDKPLHRYDAKFLERFRK